MTHSAKARKPATLVKDKPIPLRLPAKELADAHRIAGIERCSASKHVRKCYLAGKEMLYPSSSVSSSPRKRGTRGGGGNPAPAASLSKA